MKRIRVLVVDDSVVVRRLLTDILSAEPDLEVATAASGSLALAKVGPFAPDVVTLDVEMPDMSGLDVLVEIRKTHPKLPIIMFSSLTERAAATTLEALGRGATDYVTKPAGQGTRDAALADVRAQLLPRIRSLGAASSPMSRGERPRGEPPLLHASATFPAAASRGPAILALGASTGGPNAIAEVFAAIPSTFHLPIVIVQHMPPVFTRMFAERLSASCPIRFHEAKGGEALEPGHAYIAPGDYHMRVVRDGVKVKVVLDQGSQENSCRPAVDVLFRSVVALYGPSTMAVVLTGMGRDGFAGAEAVRAAKGQIIVQDEATSVVWGMPGFIAQAKIADAVVPLSDVAPEILRRAGTDARHPSLPLERRHVS